MSTILIMGLPGSGKTNLAEKLASLLMSSNVTVNWYNADKVREHLDDWDFSYEGRFRQAHRMKNLADSSESVHTIIDMVAPLEEFREIINPDVLIWVDTISSGRYPDTNILFTPPKKYDIRIIDHNFDKWYEKILDLIY